MHDGVDFVLSENGFELAAVTEINLAKDRLGMKRGFVTLDQAVQRNNFDSPRNQKFRANASDVSGGSGD